MGARLRHREYDQRLIDIGYGRADQFIPGGKDLLNTALHVLLIQNPDLHIISHQRLYAVFAENAFCLTLINTGSCYVNVVESGNTFYYFTCHITD